MIDFISELESDRKRDSELKHIKESTDYKLRVIKKKKDEARDICLDTLFSNLYKNAVPMSDEEKNAPYNDLDDEFMQFMKAKKPEGTTYYVKEAIKKGSKPCKVLLEQVDSLLHDIFLEYEMNVKNIDADEIEFDPQEQKISDKLEEISANMEFDQLSEAIQNNVKIAANNEIKRVREEQEKIKDLEDSLKNDETVTSESAIEKELVLRGIKKPNPTFYQPTLFEGVMINKLNLIKESKESEYLDETAKHKLAFVESVKEMTKLSILQSFAMESFNSKEKKELAKRYANMTEKGDIPMLREDRIQIYTMMTEGANLDSRREFKDFKKKYSEMMKEAKKLVKENEFDKAISKLNECKKLVHSTYSKLEKEKGEVGSFLFGWLFGEIPFLLRNIISVILSIPTFGIVGFVDNVAKFIERINVVIKDVGKKDKVELDDFNFYRNALKVRITEYDKIVDKTISMIKESKKNKK